MTLGTPAPTEQWVRLDLNVTGQDSGLPAVLTIWVAHQPLDVNGDTLNNIGDATAFGAQFNGDMELRLIDLNCDGFIDVRDASAFGDIWNGRNGASKAWQGSRLPAKP